MPGQVPVHLLRWVKDLGLDAKGSGENSEGVRPGRYTRPGSVFSYVFNYETFPMHRGVQKTVQQIPINPPPRPSRCQRFSVFQADLLYVLSF